MNETYVHEGIEVKKTGRVAEKKINTVPGRAPRIMQLIEITPVKEFDWVKWVSPDALYSVKSTDD